MRWAGMVFCASLGLAALAAQASSPDRWPLPPSRPPDLPGTPQAQPTGPLPVSSGPAARSPPALPPADACLEELAQARTEADPAPNPPTPLPDCAIPTPVRLKTIGLTSGATLNLPARPILDCRFAKIFADFVRTVAAPLAEASLGSPLAALDTGPGYACRARNGVTGARTSAHGEGIAIDVTAFVLADKRRIAIGRPADAPQTLFLRAVRTAACGWFTTILGPGSDAAHADHLHLDALQHGSNGHYRICE